MADAVVFKCTASVQRKEGKEALEGIFQNNRFMFYNLPVRHVSAHNHSGNEMKVFVVSSSESRIDPDAFGVENYPSTSFGKLSH